MSVAIVAQGARSQLLIKKQSALGVVATGNFSRLRYNTHSLNVAKDMFEANEIRGDREVYDARHGNRSARGDVAVDLTFGDHDTLIESVMFNPFDTDSVQIGVTPQYLSIEDGALDIAQYRLFESMVGNTMQLSIRPNQMVTATFGMIGLDGGAPAGSSSGGTPVAPTANSPFDSFNGALYDNAEESGNEVAVVTSLELSVDNGVSPAFAVGQQTPIFLGFGRGRVSGTRDRLLPGCEVADALPERDGVPARHEHHRSGRQRHGVPDAAGEVLRRRRSGRERAEPNHHDALHRHEGYRDRLRPQDLQGLSPPRGAPVPQKEPIMDLSTLDVAAAAEEGAELHLRHPTTNELLFDGDDKVPVTITLAGADSERFRSARARADQPSAPQAWPRGCDDRGGRGGCCRASGRVDPRMVRDRARRRGPCLHTHEREEALSAHVVGS